MNRRKLILTAAIIAIVHNWCNATPKITEKNNTLIMENSALQVPLTSGSHYLFSFRDKKSKQTFLFKTLIWYHGRSGNSRHFYHDQSEAEWPLKKHSIEYKGEEATLNLFSQNVDWNVKRSITMFGDKPWLRLRYTLTARDNMEQGKYNYLIMRINNIADKMSYNTNTQMTKFKTVKASPPQKDILKSHLLFFHSPKYNRTMLVVPNLNAPLNAGYTDGSSPKISKLKWCWSFSLTHPYLPAIPHFSKGQKLVWEYYFNMLDGGTLSPQQQQAASDFSNKLHLTPKPFKFSSQQKEHSQPSSQAGILNNNSQLTIWTENSLKKVYPETRIPERKMSAAKLKSARNEWESTQIVLNPKTTMTLLKADISDLKNGSSVITPENVRIYYLGYKQRNTTASAYKIIGNKIPDVLFPIKNKFPQKLAPGQNQPIWISVYTPNQANSGNYHGSLRLKLRDSKGNEFVESVPLQLTVWNFTLPAKVPFRFYGLIWHAPQKQREQYLKRLAECKMSGTILSGGVRDINKYFDGKKVNMPQFFNLAEKAVKQFGANSLHIPFAFMGPWNWRPGKRVYFKQMNPTTKEFKQQYSAYIKGCADELRKRGILKQSFAYLWDEITEPAYPMFEYTTKLTKQAAPDLNILTVAPPDPEVVKYSDIICCGPFSQWWSKEGKAVVQKGKAQGKEFWVYLNGETFIPESPAVITRLTPWRCWSRGLTGYLQWTMDNAWKRSFDVSGSVWLLYPSSHGPVLSVRLEYFRDGIDDFSYFELLKKLPDSKQKSLKKAIYKIAPEFGKTVIDPEALLATRNLIGDALSRNNKKRESN
jgi:hypothetical protein